MHGTHKRAKITERRQRRRERPEDHSALIEAVKAEQASKAGRQHRSFKAPVIAPITAAQRRLDGAIFSSVLTFAVGPAGVGKTWLTAARMAEAFVNGDVDRLIVTRPAAAAGEELGFLPGDLTEKIAPWAKPVYDVFAEVMGPGRLEYETKAGAIEFSPLGFLRGNTFKRALVLLDEAQNTTPGQMKLVLTRVGEGCRIVVDGDLAQKDIPGFSGLEDAMRRLAHVNDVSIVRFTVDDIVRSGFCRDVIVAYDQPVPDTIVPFSTLRGLANAA